MVRLGHGRPMVMIHGLLVGSAASWYFTSATALARTHDVILYDLRGHGLSSRPRTGYDLETMSRDLAAITVALPEPLTIVGHSYGALIALRFAIDCPERVARLVLVEAPTEGAELEQWGLVQDGVGAPEPADIVENLPSVVRNLFAQGGRPARRLAETVRFLVYETTLLSDLAAEPRFIESELAGLPCEVRLFYGAESRCLAAGQRLHWAIPQSRLDILPGGHFLHLEANSPLTGYLVDACRG